MLTHVKVYIHLIIWSERDNEYREETKAIYFYIIYIWLGLGLGLWLGFGLGLVFGPEIIQEVDEETVKLVGF